MRQRLWQAVMITAGLYLMLSVQQRSVAVEHQEIEVSVSDLISRIFP